MVEPKNFIDICPVCKLGVQKIDMVFQKGRVFHTQCYLKHGSKYPPIDTDLASLSARTRVELVQLKNLKVRQDQERQKRPKKAKAKKKTPKKKPKKTKAASKKKKAKKTKKKR